MKVALIIFIIIFIILIMRIRLIIDVKDRPVIRIGYFLFRFKLNDKKKKIKKDKKINISQKKKKKASKKKSESDKSENKFEKVLNTVIDLLKSLPKPLKRLIGSTVIQIKRIYISIGADDAAKAAIEYGNTCNLVYAGTSALQNFFIVRAEADDIRIGVNFLAEETKKDILICVKIRIITILIVAVSIAVKFLLNTINRTKNNQQAIVKN